MTTPINPLSELIANYDRLVAVESSAAFSSGRWTEREAIGDGDYRMRLRKEALQLREAIAYWTGETRKALAKTGKDN